MCVCVCVYVWVGVVCVFGVCVWCVCLRGRGCGEMHLILVSGLGFFLLLISLKPTFPHFPLIN